jgi:hypothetical protein
LFRCKFCVSFEAKRELCSLPIFLLASICFKIFVPLRSTRILQSVFTIF